MNKKIFLILVFLILTSCGNHYTFIEEDQITECVVECLSNDYCAMNFEFETQECECLECE